ncbi:conserved protein of unknown function [Blastococcus saxobsidens DD2]|uniref:Uncharacterized protein n=1 Tax=Blastococcus saxobsidens (strain DD2) TaxID=1146883 RepID=H6RKZ6_BLASD|nr:conserved protein of unknown function [Blastococcus saxobsidens DD2]
MPAGGDRGERPGDDVGVDPVAGRQHTDVRHGRGQCDGDRHEVPDL